MDGEQVLASQLTTLHVKNYRSIEDITLNMTPLTVLVGTNGSGKSNLVDVLRFVRDALTIGLENAVLNRGGMDALRRWGRRGRPYDVHIGMEFQFRVPTKKRISLIQAEYTFTLASQHGGYRVKRERYYGQDGEHTFGYELKEGDWIQPPYDESISDAESRSLPIPRQTRPVPQTNLYLPMSFPFSFSRHVQKFIRGMGFYTIYPNLLREPQKPATPYPLDERGQNLASLLRDLKKRRRGASSGAFTRILEALSIAVEDVNDISVRQAGGYLVTHLHHGEDGPTFPLLQESDGTLRLLGLLTALYQSSTRLATNTLLGIEEPELTIHPGALGVLRDVLLEVSQRTQLLITTHSPDLLYAIPVESIHVVEKVNHITEVGPVAETQRQAIAEKLFAPGELMRIEGLRRAE